MPVTIPLAELVRLENSRPLWPPDFDAFIKSIEKKPSDRTGWGACADWLDEEPVAEPAFAAAFRYVDTHRDVIVYKQDGPTYSDPKVFRVNGLVQDVLDVMPQRLWPTVAHFAADLSKALPIARENVRKKMEALE